MLRMRQICLVAEDLDTIEAHLRGVFGLQICYRDEGVAAFGLHNFLMPIGNSFWRWCRRRGRGRPAGAFWIVAGATAATW